ncbi:MAG: DNA topoisomerase IB [Sumerlaeia bacterium]
MSAPYRPSHPEPIPGDPVRSARRAGLRYVSDTEPGITRRRAGKGWSYRDPSGARIDDPAVRERCNRLAIPPAYRDVWICPDPRGHLQATGRDARGRKQYRYHALWQRIRNAHKFDTLIAFGHALPGLRARLDEDLRRHRLSRERVVAAVVRLLDRTLIRVGNDEYARENESYGLTTMTQEHVDARGGSLTFHFRGKSGRQHELCVTDPRAARVVRQCEELPGQRLFQYLDGDGGRHAVSSEDVNDYLETAMGQEFSAKDFRTWGGTVAAAMALREAGPPDSEKSADKAIVSAIKEAAAVLGNTAATCRKYYVHPGVLQSYREGGLAKAFDRCLGQDREGLRPEEAAVLCVLERERAESLEPLTGERHPR